MNHSYTIESDEAAAVNDQNASISDSNNIGSPNDIDILLISEMSNRCRNTLLRNGIRTLNELRESYESGRLSSLKNVGNKVLEEVKGILESGNSTIIQRRIPLNYQTTNSTALHFTRRCFIDLFQNKLLWFSGCSK